MRTLYLHKIVIVIFYIRYERKFLTLYKHKLFLTKWCILQSCDDPFKSIRNNIYTIRYELLPEELLKTYNENEMNFKNSLKKIWDIKDFLPPKNLKSV